MRRVPSSLRDRGAARGAGGPRGGFSLVEILCALLILGVGVVGVSQGITLAWRTSKDSELGSAAALLASGRIEKLRADGFLREREEDGDFAPEFPAYAWEETIAKTETDGLFEVTEIVKLARTGEVLLELRTLLFDTPLTSDFGAPSARGPGGYGPASRPSPPGGMR